MDVGSLISGTAQARASSSGDLSSLLSVVSCRPHNGLCITRSPDSNAEMRHMARQPGAVQLYAFTGGSLIGTS